MSMVKSGFHKVTGQTSATFMKLESDIFRSLVGEFVRTGWPQELEGAYLLKTFSENVLLLKKFIFNKAASF